MRFVALAVLLFVVSVVNAQTWQLYPPPSNLTSGSQASTNRIQAGTNRDLLNVRVDEATAALDEAEYLADLLYCILYNNSEAETDQGRMDEAHAATVDYFAQIGWIDADNGQPDHGLWKQLRDTAWSKHSAGNVKGQQGDDNPNGIGIISRAQLYVHASERFTEGETAAGVVLTAANNLCESIQAAIDAAIEEAEDGE